MTKTQPQSFLNTGAAPHPGQQAARETSAPTKSSLFAIMLAMYGDEKVLGNGQLVPLWTVNNGFQTASGKRGHAVSPEAARWRRTETPFEVQGYFATGDQDNLSADGRKFPIESLENLILLEESGQLDTASREHQAAHTRAARALLNGVGGVCTIRPGAKPIGMIPLAGRKAVGGLVIEERQASPLEFHRLARTCNRTTEPAPQIQFYVSAASGAQAWDVSAKQHVSVIPLPDLPASFYTAQELGLSGEHDEYGWNYDTDMLAGVVAMLAHMNIVDGFIYAGFEMGASEPSETEWRLEDINEGVEMPLYDLPWTSDLPLLALNPEAKAQAQALIRGNFRRHVSGKPTLFR
jgi:hypothetical protein